MVRAVLRPAVAVLALSSALACGSNDRESPSRPGADAAPDLDVADAAPAVITPTSMFVHSDTTLYAVDDQDFDLIHIGEFGLGEEDLVTDLAVTRDGDVYAISSDNVFAVDAETGHATLTTGFDGGLNVGMTFLDSGELLVAEKNGTVRRLDPDSGEVTMVGVFGGGYGTAGDLVAVSDGTMYAIAEDLDGADGDPNILVTIDPASGEVDQVIGPIGFADVFGCAYARGHVYAFTKGGDIIEVDRTTGAGTLKRSYPDLTFWGAGVSPAVEVE
jgi:outer membrane protein assembly factor BamB